MRFNPLALKMFLDKTPVVFDAKHKNLNPPRIEFENIGFRQWIETTSPETLYNLIQNGPFYHYTRQPSFYPNPKHISQILVGSNGLFVSPDPKRWRDWAKQNGYKYIAIVDLSNITIQDIEASNGLMWGNEEEIYIPSNLVGKVKVVRMEKI